MLMAPLSRRGRGQVQSPCPSGAGGRGGHTCGAPATPNAIYPQSMGNLTGLNLSLFVVAALSMNAALWLAWAITTAVLAVWLLVGYLRA